MSKFLERDLIYIDFDPSKGSEINKRRPALVISRNEYNQNGRLAIVCPITSTPKERRFLVPLNNAIEKGLLKEGSKVNIAQVASLDVSENGDRNPEKIGELDLEEFYKVIQYFLYNFNNPARF
ncbi:type II toxin-antitoxin system PemK/MazF family toxin [Xylocopilactobacillus apicola]|uniref:mRNA interferase PemK n=1 Tax=Xylocopilactobacillus apicola TaxID=2932184 RepID=A0AAU9DR55_9LACO|nr:type II toxin-antitoxin system PemK/MazF family toxin [Xylocopilactobacillus apicola]BDR59697.1 mRNA interferase PemK [Xylocopilactobacillus apicola]